MSDSVETLSHCELQRTYQVEVDAGDINVSIIGKLVSKGTRFRGVVYWAFFGRAIIHLIDPDDIVRAEEVRIQLSRSTCPMTSTTATGLSTYELMVN